MWEVIKEWLSSPVLGVVVGIAGLIAAVVTYVLTRQRTILAFGSKGIRLLGHAEADLPQEVQVLYAGKNIPRLTRTMAVVWNAGERTISGSDVVLTDPLRFRVESDEQILSASIIKQSRDVIGVECVSLSLSDVALRFDFIDQNDGFVVEFLHTSKNRHVSLVGTVKGMPSGPKNIGRIVAQKSRVIDFPFIPFATSLEIKISRAWLIASMALTGIGMTAAGIFVPNLQSASSFGDRSSRVVFISTGIIYSLTALFMGWRLRRRYPRALKADGIE